MSPPLGDGMTFCEAFTPMFGVDLPLNSWLNNYINDNAPVHHSCHSPLGWLRIDWKWWFQAAQKEEVRICPGKYATITEKNHFLWFCLFCSFTRLWINKELHKVIPKQFHTSLLNIAVGINKHHVWWADMGGKMMSIVKPAGAPEHLNRHITQLLHGPN